MFGVEGGVHGMDKTSSLILLPFDGCLLFIGLPTNLSGKREKSEKCEYPPTDCDRSLGFGGLRDIVFSSSLKSEKVDDVAAFDSSNAANWAGFSFKMPESADALFQSAHAIGVDIFAIFEGVVVSSSSSGMFTFSFVPP